ncbi:glycosyl hydrolase family 28 protein [Phocaeicola plebeius]|jgi:polygalacturonase|uniref:Exopolygalacturonase n=2 Tax=Phocaeicola plebeius TaxID=310297 RepID=A0A415JGF8_9BACT|nr:glycosyl hydrolase family 28 protein [Phocaeicola plebeius]RHL00753.1 exopolygalacturonase [Phocaeicola plebeius]RHL20188.1 exopolygalacturonase [Phocaeicola plebeius]
MRGYCVKGWLLWCLSWMAVSVFASEIFPDGTPIPEWFREHRVVSVKELGKQYCITNYGVQNDSTILQTERIQAVIDKAAQDGGGVICIPKGTFLSGSLFFRPRTHLYLEKGATLKGSDDISHFDVIDTRLEGQNLTYFAALVNVIGVDGFTLSGEGKINGNGLRFWKSFWLRRQVNPQCTNLEELRPRLVYIADSRNVQLSGVRLENSPFWTTHLYRCENVKLLNLSIFAPHSPVKAPSSDAIDIDVCKNVLVKGCYMSVNDDAIALKGGKGPWADQDKVNNGSNMNIIIEDCVWGFCHSALTCGSESIHNRNILVRRCRVEHAQRLLWLKMRPDTPQNYEYIQLEDITGSAINFLFAQPWTQFFDLKDRKDVPYSYSSHVTMRNIQLDCDVLFAVKKDETQYKLSDFLFENLKITARKSGEICKDYIHNLQIRNVTVNGVHLK